MQRAKIGRSRVFVRVCRYVVPLILIALAWTHRDGIAERVERVDARAMLESALPAVLSVDWQASAVILGCVHAVLAGIGLLRRRYRWTTRAIGRAVREESARMGRTSILLVLPAIWDGITLLAGLLRGFERREDGADGKTTHGPAVPRDTFVRWIDSFDRRLAAVEGRRATRCVRATDTTEWDDAP